MSLESHKQKAKYILNAVLSGTMNDQGLEALIIRRLEGAANETRRETSQQIEEMTDLIRRLQGIVSDYEKAVPAPIQHKWVADVDDLNNNTYWTLDDNEIGRRYRVSRVFRNDSLAYISEVCKFCESENTPEEQLQFELLPTENRHYLIQAKQVCQQHREERHRQKLAFELELRNFGAGAT